VRAILIGCALLLVLPAHFSAPAIERQSVEADGIAPIQGGNLAQARDRAMTQALRGAIEKTIRSSVPPETLDGRKAVSTRRSTRRPSDTSSNTGSCGRRSRTVPTRSRSARPSMRTR